LDQVDGVASSSANEDGTLVRVDLHPNADPENVVGAVRRIIREGIEDRTPEALDESETATVPPQVRWRDQKQIAEAAAIVSAPSVEQPEEGLSLWRLVWLAIAVVIVGWWRHRVAARTKAQRSQPSSRRLPRGGRQILPWPAGTR
jgi:hypothetical protein